MRRPREGTASLAFSWVTGTARYFYYVPAYRPADDNRNAVPVRYIGSLEKEAWIEAASVNKVSWKFACIKN